VESIGKVRGYHIGLHVGSVWPIAGSDGGNALVALLPLAVSDAPRHMDLKKDRGLTIEWADGSTSYYSIAYLRRMSPSAEMKQLREEQAKNPLAVLPASVARAMSSSGGGAGGAGLVAVDAELVGNYAIRIRFSDGHDTGLFSWSYLREIDPENKDRRAAGGRTEASSAADATKSLNQNPTQGKPTPFPLPLRGGFGTESKPESGA
jgi:DUF971 family protein